MRKPFEYRIEPEFSTGTRKLTGSMSSLINLTPSGGPFNRIAAGFYGRYNHYDRDLAFFRFSPSATFFFRRNYAASDILQKIRLRGVLLQQEYLIPDADVFSTSYTGYRIWSGTYSLENINVLKPYTIIADMQLGDKFSLISTTADFRWMLPNRRWLIWRNFAGGFLSNKTEADEIILGKYNSLGLSGTQDYLFDYEFIGRSEESGIWSQQFFITDGGFKSETGVLAESYMLTSNISVPIWNIFEIKGISPSLGVFGDVGVVDRMDKIYWDYGARLSFFTDFLEFYLPVQNQSVNFLEQSNYLQHIRFVFNLDPSEIIERIRRGYY